jgi:hypothetical protein
MLLLFQCSFAQEAFEYGPLFSAFSLTCYSTEPPKELKELVRKQSVAKATQQNQLSVCMLTFGMLSSPALTG